MKKLLSVIMLVCIVMSMCTVSALAASEKIELSGAWITHDGGREIYIEIYTGNKNTGCAAKFTFEHDRIGFKFLRN